MKHGTSFQLSRSPTELNQKRKLHFLKTGSPLSLSERKEGISAYTAANQMLTLQLLVLNESLDLLKRGCWVSPTPQEAIGKPKPLDGTALSQQCSHRTPEIAANHTQGNKMHEQLSLLYSFEIKYILLFSISVILISSLSSRNSSCIINHVYKL